MNKTKLEERIREIDEDFDKIEYRGRKAIGDGIINLDKYLASGLKIMWILKEVNSLDDCGGWDMREVFRKFKDENTTTGIKSGWDKTYLPVIYTTYGILNNKFWNDIPYVYEDEKLLDDFEKIAIVNIKKVSGLAQAVSTELHEFFNEYGYVLKKQIEYYQPNVIICGGSWDIIDDLLDEIFGNPIEPPKKNNETKTTSYLYRDLIIVYTKHPQALINKELYCNTIIQDVLNWKSKYLK